MAEHRSSPPRGRDEVVEALIDAATRLFAQRGPAAVSLREVANEAGVNVGLIHRHIGGKADLLAAVLRSRVPFDSSGPFGGETTLADLFVDRAALPFGPSLFTQIQARTILDGFDLREVQDRFPLVERLLADFSAQLPRDEAASRSAFVAAAILGWLVFGETFMAAAGNADRTGTDLARDLEPVIRFLVGPPPPPG